MANDTSSNDGAVPGGRVVTVEVDVEVDEEVAPVEVVAGPGPSEQATNRTAAASTMGEPGLIGARIRASES